MSPETRTAAHVALAKHSPYIECSLPEGCTLAEYRHNRARKRSRWQMLVRRINGHG